MTPTPLVDDCLREEKEGFWGGGGGGGIVQG